jgi:hypothetical protein
LNAQSIGEIDAAFATIVESRAGALLIGNSILFNNRRRQLAALAARHGVAAIGGVREFVLAGGLMSYGASDPDAYRRAGSHYVAPTSRAPFTKEWNAMFGFVTYANALRAPQRGRAGP